MTTQTAAKLPVKRKNQIWRTVWSYKGLYLMLLFPMIFFAVFRYAPLYGIQLAFKDFKLAGIWASPWNNFEHFRFMMLEPGFIPALRNTVIISLMRIVLGFPFPILLAIMINEAYTPRYRRVLQTIYTFPHFLSWVLLAGIMLNLFGSDGMVRKVIMTINQDAAQNWDLLYNGDAYRWIVVISDIWKEGGWGTIIYLAAIAGVDQSLYEAATIDGCGRIKQIWHIMIPGIISMIAIQFVLRIGGIMTGGFDQIFNTYSPPVYDKGDILDTYIYRISFGRVTNVNMGFPVAVGLFKNVINFALLFAANYIVRALGQETIL